MILAMVAFALSYLMMGDFSDRLTLANDLGEKYACVFNEPAGEDIAKEFKDAMDITVTVYMVLLVGCILSCLGGPILVLRWVSIPFHMIFGMGLQLYATFVVY